MAETVAQMIYAESLRRLDRQAGSLDELRARSATLLQAASIIAAFLGAEAFSVDEPGVFAWCAAVAFTLVLSSGMFVLWPRNGWVFSNNVRTLLEDLEANLYADAEAFWLSTAGFNAGHADNNEKKLRRIARAVEFAVLALLLEALFLFGALVCT